MIVDFVHGVAKKHSSWYSLALANKLSIKSVTKVCTKLFFLLHYFEEKKELSTA